MLSSLQLKELRFGEVEELTPGHKVGKRQSWDLNQDTLLRCGTYCAAFKRSVTGHRVHMACPRNSVITSRYNSSTGRFASLRLE